MRLFFIMLSAAFFMAGCAQNGTQNEVQNTRSLYGQNETSNGTTFLSNSNSERDEQIQRTREHTMDEQNPNFLNLDGNAVDQSDDINHAKETVRIAGFETDQVWINGEKLWVTAFHNDRMNQEEKIDAEAILHKALVKALPRYDIEVRVNEER
ncbi:hypothetical protein [Cytobacillus gottheilii]|uniref:Sporulation protein n=1 Tax=Cytobacillus gottheilii TaxID=859144 RepID=A0ABX8FD76_9BACI|nr:hypothetical protein [Cytobacillus gottheilii]QVY61391.1 hypothetical protein J1899_21010 [Cytobacillus gottheilii]